MLHLLLLGLLAAGPASSACPTTTTAPLGPEHAPVRVEVFLDPISDEALLQWLDLRRVAAEQAGRVRLDVAFVRGAGVVEPQVDEVRRFAIAMARRGRLESILRLLQREGHERVLARLRDPAGGPALAKLMGLSADALGRALVDRCAESALHHASRSLSERFERTGSAVYRLPVFEVDDVLSEDLELLRSELARRPVRLAEGRRPRVLGPPAARPSSARLRRPRLGGVLLGGPGLPHRFVVMGHDEDDPTLVMLLPPVLDYRSTHPAEIAIHIVARGNSVGGMRLRHRLCAARMLGREREYVTFLARDRLAARLPNRAETALLDALDDVPEERCEREPDPGDQGLPDGGWLDGLPRTRSELDNLASTLRMLEAAARPLSPALPPARDEP